MSDSESFFAIQFDDDFQEHIASIIAEGDRCSIEIVQTEHGIGHTLWFRGPDKTELRLLLLGTLRLSISRVEFKNKSQGTMQKILEVLIEFCKNKKIQMIVIQSVVTKEMASFCLKNGFIPDTYRSIFSDGYTAGDYYYQLKFKN